MERKIITLQCSNCTWCPTLEFKEKEVFIKDDEGNKIRLSSEQWNLLVKKVMKREISYIGKEEK